VKPSLDEGQVAQWRGFANEVPWADYHQDPAWGAIYEADTSNKVRKPFFFWGEVDGRICLTGVGVRRRLPVPNRFFWEFERGPLVCDLTVMDRWLSWLSEWLGSRAIRVRVQPAMPLLEAGDDAETILERQGFVRRRLLGIWSTLLVDISLPEDQIFAAFSPYVRHRIRRSARLGIEVHCDDSPTGWSVLSNLQAELSKRAPVPPISEAAARATSLCWLNGGSGGTVLVASLGDKVLAAAMIPIYRGTAYLRVIPSSGKHRELPTSFSLLWEAMRWARAQGCDTFDLGGYSLAARPEDPLWGVNEFKRRFAPYQIPCRSVAVHERVSSTLVAEIGTALRHTQDRGRRLLRR